MVTLAIDPGDVHVGWALHTDSGWDADGVPHLIVTGEVHNRDAATWLDAQLKVLRKQHFPNQVEVVIEEYVLYPGQDQKKTWSKHHTSELIGVLKHICGQYHVRWIEQGANIKKPTRAQLRGRGIRQVGKNTHEKDAELHLLYRVLRRWKQERDAESA
jgi:hypothetical protein